MFKMTITATLENADGVMCEQTTVWHAMSHSEMLALETSYVDWVASLPRTIGAPVVTKEVT